MPVRILASPLAKRFCDRNFTGAFAAFVAYSLEPSSFSVPVLTLQIMHSSFCSKTAIDFRIQFFISAFYFFLPLSTEQTEKAFVPVQSDEC